MKEINITPMAPGQFGVELEEAQGVRTSHVVTVPESLVEELAIPDLDQEHLVRESFAFLLEREPQTSIMREFALPVISSHFPEYMSEIRARLAAG